MRLTLPILLAGLALSAGPASADWAPDGPALGQLARGGVHAEVHPDGDGVSGVVFGAVEIAASPDVVWRTITDCGRAAHMAPNIRSCRITGRDPDGRWDVREMVVRSGLLPSFRTEFRSDFTPLRSIRFRCTAGDIRYCKGEWRLEPLAGVCKSAGLFRASLIFKAGEFGGGHDFIDWYARAMEAGARTLTLPEVLFERRIHEHSMGMSDKAGQTKGYLLTLKAMLDRRRAGTANNGNL